MTIIDYFIFVGILLLLTFGFIALIKPVSTFIKNKLPGQIDLYIFVGAFVIFGSYFYNLWNFCRIMIYRQK